MRSIQAFEVQINSLLSLGCVAYASSHLTRAPRALRSTFAAGSDRRRRAGVLPVRKKDVAEPSEKRRVKRAMSSSQATQNHNSASRSRPNSILDVYSLLLAVFLFASPWLFAYGNGTARIDLWVGGALVAITSVAAIVAFSSAASYPPPGAARMIAPGSRQSVTRLLSRME